MKFTKTAWHASSRCYEFPSSQSELFKIQKKRFHTVGRNSTPFRCENFLILRWKEGYTFSDSHLWDLLRALRHPINVLIIREIGRYMHWISQMRSRNFGLQLTELPDSKGHHSDSCKIVEAGALFSYISTNCPEELRTIISAPPRRPCDTLSGIRWRRQ